ncbi:hypothetical protein ACFWR9_31755 [Streptomyces sp. NPDC058534]|uniref:hypothetical protein n=1 Tax=Streptomyces sp. NPDC058534 TaxID=3346541 RepID=UPI0036511178
MGTVVAVVGTLLGTLAGAVITGWWQREAIRVTVRAEHTKDRHQPRSDAYKAFIRSAIALRERVLDNDGYEDSTEAEEKRLRSEINALWTELVFLGPRSVNLIASVLLDAYLDIIRQMVDSRHLRDSWPRIANSHTDEDAEEDARQDYENSLHTLEHLAGELTLGINAFAAVASTFLNDDGTTPRRARLWKKRRHLPPPILERP